MRIFFQTVSEEMILQQKNFRAKHFLTKKNVLPEKVLTKLFLVRTVSEEIILQQKNFQWKKIFTKFFFIQTVSEEMI